jgi:hypothetical protein
MKPAFTLAFAAGLALAACTDDPSPRSTITSITPDRVTPADDALDDLTIALRYDDLDGDLGDGVAEVHDCRSDAIMIALAIPPIAAAPGQHITGTLELHVNDVAAVAPAAQPAVCHDLGVAPATRDTAVFCVVLVDAAGHRGTGACAPPVAIAL